MFSLADQEFITNSTRERGFIAVEECFCGVLSYQDFDRIMSRTANRDLLRDITRLSHISFFSKWDIHVIKAIIAASTIVHYAINNTVFLDG